MDDQPWTTCGAGAYVRDPVGVWRYRWGAAVPGATDVLARDLVPSPSARPDQEPPRWVREGWLPIDVAPGAGAPRDLVGMRAPETAWSRLRSREDLVPVASLTPAPLPQPQVVLADGQAWWTWPVVRHWLAHQQASVRR
jgi:hypothetical protein